MSDEKVMRQGVPEMELRTVANSGDDRLRIGSHAPIDLRALGSQIFAVGLDAAGKHQAFAERMEMQASVLSEMRNGKRIVPYHLMLGLLMTDEPTARVILARECELARLPAPAVDTIRMTTSEATALNRVRRRMGSVWPYFGADFAAQEYRCTLEHLDAAIDLMIKASGE